MKQMRHLKQLLKQVISSYVLPLEIDRTTCIKPLVPQYMKCLLDLKQVIMKETREELGMNESVTLVHGDDVHKDTFKKESLVDTLKARLRSNLHLK